MKNMIAFLMENANPSIKLRVKKEVLGTVSAEEEAAWTALVRGEPIYRSLKAQYTELYSQNLFLAFQGPSFPLIPL